MICPNCKGVGCIPHPSGSTLAEVFSQCGVCRGAGFINDIPGQDLDSTKPTYDMGRAALKAEVLKEIDREISIFKLLTGAEHHIDLEALRARVEAMK